MNVTIELPPDVESKLRSQAAESGQDLQLCLLNALRIGTQRSIAPNQSAAPNSDDEDADESPWRGVFAIDIPYKKYENLGPIELNPPLSDWAPHIVISSRWIDDDDE